MSAHGRTELSKVQLIRDGMVVYDHAPATDLPDGWLRLPVDVAWGSHLGQPHTWDGLLRVDGAPHVLRTKYYAPRVPEGDGFPNHGGLGVTVEGPADAQIEVQAGLLRLNGRLGDLARTAWQAEQLGATLRVRPGLGGLTGFGTDGVSATWTAPCSTWSRNYLRVVQIDGEAARSSPIWVDPA